MPRKKSTDVPTKAPALSAVPTPRVPRSVKATIAPLITQAPAAPSFDEIATAAYLRFLDRGGRHGSDFDDWVEAERELSASRGYAKAG